MMMITQARDTPVNLQTDEISYTSNYKKVSLNLWAPTRTLSTSHEVIEEET